MVAELEEARAFGELVKQGWRPKRTIVYCAWDGEEPGLLGSTEWVETHADDLQQHAVVYINTDSNSRGFLAHRRLAHAGEIHQRRGARDRQIPRSTCTVWSGAQWRQIARPTSAERQAPRCAAGPTCASARWARLRLHAFLDHLGIAVARTGLRRRGQAAASITPSTTISIGTRISPIPISSTAARWRRLGGTAVMRMADAELLPYRVHRPRGHRGDLRG